MKLVIYHLKVLQIARVLIITKITTVLSSNQVNLKINTKNRESKSLQKSINNNIQIETWEFWYTCTGKLVVLYGFSFIFNAIPCYFISILPLFSRTLT